MWIYVNLCELIWIYVWIVRLSGSAAMCGSTSGSVWQCTRRQCAAVRLVVYGSTRGSVWLSGSAAVRGCVRRCAWQCAAVRAAMGGSVCLCVAVSTVVSAHCTQCARQCAAVRLVVYSVCGNTAVRVWQCGSGGQCALLCAAVCAAVRGSVHSGVRSVIYEPNIPRVAIVTEHYELLIRIKVNENIWIDMNLCELI